MKTDEILKELYSTILFQLPPIKPIPRIYVSKDKFDLFLSAISPMHRFQDTEIHNQGVENFVYAKCAICCLKEPVDEKLSDI